MVDYALILSLRGSNESRAALSPGRSRGGAAAVSLHPSLVRGRMRHEVVNAMLLSDCLLVPDCVVIACNLCLRQKSSDFEDFCNTGKNFPKEKVEIQNKKRKL
jgi:hypothetical protein